MKKHAEICPVCKGSGKYVETKGNNYSAYVSYERACHGCNGYGWVTVTDNEMEYSSTGISYNSEFCEKPDQKPIEFCDEDLKKFNEKLDIFKEALDKHIPHID